MAATRKVLMLHGYTQNGSIFSKRLGAIRKACGRDIDFVFVDAPHILKPVDLANMPASLVLEAAEARAEDPALVPRAWWRANQERTVTFGMKESLIVLRDLLKETRFHGVFGFSQGAALAALLSALLEKPDVLPEFLVDGQAPHPPFEFCVAVSGYKVADPIANAAFATPYATPTLHIIGKNDIIVVEERSRPLTAVSENKRVEEHDGGHFVPSKANWRKFLGDYLRNPLADLPSPRHSTAGSGTVTPMGVDESITL